MTYWFFFWFAAAVLSWCAGVVHSLIKDDDPMSGYVEIQIVGLCFAVLLSSVVCLVGYNLFTTGNLF
jgi:hypothetical protein